jgi:hypothetical protein
VLHSVAVVIGLIASIGHNNLIFILGKVTTLVAALPYYIYLSRFWHQHLQSTGHNSSADRRISCHFTIYLYWLGWIGFDCYLARLPVLDNSLSSLQSDDEHI